MKSNACSPTWLASSLQARIPRTLFPCASSFGEYTAIPPSPNPAKFEQRSVRRYARSRQDEECLGAKLEAARAVHPDAQEVPAIPASLSKLCTRRPQVRGDFTPASRDRRRGCAQCESAFTANRRWCFCNCLRADQCFRRDGTTAPASSDQLVTPAGCSYGPQPLRSRARDPLRTETPQRFQCRDHDLR
jgi:hypothetical protein